MNQPSISSPSARGPADHDIRNQIVAAANEHFSQYGYGKTTVSDLAKAIGFSKAYIYKFFDSKQAIGEAICTNCLAEIVAAVEQAINVETLSPTERFRRLVKTVIATGVNLFFNDRKLYDIAAFSVSERWPSSQIYDAQIKQFILQIVREGREVGEFERKTPLDETVEAIHLALRPFVNPLLLQYNLDFVEEAPTLTSNLILRSLMP
ncbi:MULTISPECIES: TetR/AcrR family transcriptional regulator [Pseudomonas]|jgi:AcrR family transcriptional regulator|uniref:TetR/AcrR family transcriptional regulator n=4 Tax=Pseudomonas chlororaphis TaxID=587753 RepID=A0AAQ1FM20_9PSED|nr:MULTISPECIES: TetR/AcrR family transcriptional regulator [Pseudomonas]AIC19378.1 AcrR family transcriptional regulator [Pseudomonas chlororaphis]AUG40424.1 TetR/AcrR family transcriptional regulator [Pseudomonas chlororaphis]AZD21587.1 Transcriptional regulator, AcrR family [Pseudomonas chlororaphis subsp. aurantiaca]AZD29003.1 Transcriptional regulator, AcrR family [Pseudomonas chlororaphis]AZD35152.1 Transcriptional regulator, AcrR family [Pseudomonas chlororaphis subsp. aurantiaca]